MPIGEVEERWQRVLSSAPALSADDLVEQLMRLYFTCLSRFVCLVSDAETAAA